MVLKIITERTKLRPLQWSDLNTVHKLHALPETDAYNTLGIPNNIEETRKVIAPWIQENEGVAIKNYVLAIENKIDAEFIGLFGLKLGHEKFKRAEVWYKLHPDYWNQGIATEVVSRMIDYCFQTLNLHRIEAGCAVENVASIKVLEKVGFIREGIGRQILPLKSGWSDNYFYAILETDKRK